MYIVKYLNVISGYLHPRLRHNFVHYMHFSLIPELPYLEAKGKPGCMLEVDDCQSTSWVIGILQEEIIEVHITVTQLEAL